MPNVLDILIIVITKITYQHSGDGLSMATSSRSLSSSNTVVDVWSVSRTGEAIACFTTTSDTSGTLVSIITPSEQTGSLASRAWL